MKRIMITRMRLASAVLAIASSALAGTESADSDLVIKLDLVESHYCLESDGGISLRAMLRLTYENTGLQGVILVRPTRVAGYKLLPLAKSEDTTEPVEVRFPKERVFDGRKLTAPRPNPKLFETLEPGRTLRREQDVLIFVADPAPSGRSLLGKEYSLEVEVDHWPDNPSSGERLRALWKDQGVLWMEALTSRPIELRIPKDPAAKRCVGRVD
jgi:hypothetical protein